MLKEFPTEEGVDLVNFNLALAYLYLGKEEKGALAFQSLIRKFPKSTYVGDSYFFIGEY